VDLDGPLLLSQDRAQGIRYEGSVAHPPGPELWGGGRSASLPSPAPDRDTLPS
jgi:hypothetical protein